MQPTWRDFHPLGRRKAPDESDTRLTFNDVIFGLVIAQIFLEAIRLGSPGAKAVWAHLALAFVVTIGSYIGYRKSLKRTRNGLSFFNLPLIQFGLDLAMIFLYYKLAVHPNLVTLKDVGAASISGKYDAKVVTTIFALYAAWDLVSLFMKWRGYDDVRFSWSRASVTWLCLGLSVGVYIGATRFSVQSFPVFWVDLALLGVCVLYRWLKDGLFIGEDDRTLALYYLRRAASSEGPGSGSVHVSAEVAKELVANNSVPVTVTWYRFRMRDTKHTEESFTEPGHLDLEIDR
jgi:hypothetical protein